MAQYITKIRTESGDLQIDYNALANKPTAESLGAAPANHNHNDRYYTESEIDSKLGVKSDSGHTHDDRYYTESEIDTKLSEKSNTNHKHTYADVGALPKILTSAEYGTSLPTAGTAGRIFFKKV